ncbi:hypothetical protein GIB67_019879 [Kingdonia uniflora]|uniref:Digalactosyldiacylglycerol synthase n=1 Tax=Kingdonia uniflora TaxID=39325 RepID=A0A7J7MKE2_9MAGN|nr:hypothetical protein GIB67_019879 [Kingdonia uniflora]
MNRKQHIAIFRTASLPWMTGTAVNPLFRAAYLTKDGECKVTLVIPWLSLKDQELVYPNKITFISPLEHETYLRRWFEEKTGFICGFDIHFYPGKFFKTKVFLTLETKCIKMQVIRLSAATQDLQGSIICNIHGVNPKFLEIGKKQQEKQQKGEQVKVVTSELRKEVPPAKSSVMVRQNSSKWFKLLYKVFLNPSTSDVVCTTAAEALAMGKIVICADHASNEFFKQFTNCYTNKDVDGFVELIHKALVEDPVPLTDGCQRKRMVDASAFVHYAASGMETARRAFGAIPGSLTSDEDQCKELELPISAQKQEAHPGKIVITL